MSETAIILGASTSKNFSGNTSIGTGKIEYGDSGKIKSLDMEFQEGNNQDAKEAFYSIGKKLYVRIVIGEDKPFTISGTVSSRGPKGYILNVKR